MGIREKLYRWMRLTSRPTVKVYTGFGGSEQLFVAGHVFSLSPLPRRRFRKNIWTNALALLRLFMVRTIPRAQLELEFQGERVRAWSGDDGFFRFLWKPRRMPDPGWYPVEVRWLGARKGTVRGEGELFIPHPTQFAIVSDIDDTFLISHSANLRKRLFVLLTENAHTRMPFEGVVRHYRALSQAGAIGTQANPFFYVSSSEWNLYGYIRRFAERQGLPRGTFLLNQLKRIGEIWKTGQSKHATKFARIARVMEMLPRQHFILLGDDSQEDPAIYAAICAHFPERIRAVYLRNVYAKKAGEADRAIAAIRALHIPVLHFRHSSEALRHSVEIGLITPGQAEQATQA